MIVYRLTKQQYEDDLSGTGAEITGGRWNSKGFRMLYTSESRALCLAEIAVHLPVGLIPRNYSLVTIEIPAHVPIGEISIKELPKNWRDYPYKLATQEIGNDFIKNQQFLALKVPSAVVQGDFNYLINPAHNELSNLKIISKEKFNFDKRLFKTN